MHQKWRAKPIDLSQVFFGIAAVISDRGVHARIAYSCKEDHQRAETVAKECDLAVAFLEVAYCVDGVLHVRRARISVISSLQTKAVRPVGIGGNTEIDARLLPPEQVRRDSKETLFGQFVAMLPNVCVHPE
jgi:hypothetical protein